MNDRVDGAAIVAAGISAGYGERRVLERISLEVRPGELVAIVGPNGAGKSTLLKVLGGLLEPWEGSVAIAGRALREFDRRALARTLAVVGQESGVAFPFTALEVVMMGRAPHLGPMSFESRADVEIAREALARMGLLGLAARYVQELSGGERRCVVIARALAQQPKIALLDEPTAFLDLKHIAQIFDVFCGLCAEHGLAVVATLHDLNAAANYADRVMLLKDGVAVACGAPQEVLTAENLRHVYETDVYVGRNPATGAVAILPAGTHR
jgi:ABC-type cobalamin/Fe3+-siderophores transport system ATPase subunit